jgi:hypothetical protein
LGCQGLFGRLQFPDGFAEATLLIPPLKGKTLYLKLRDDPATVDTAIVPTLANSP